MSGYSCAWRERAPKHAAGSAEEESAQTAARLGCAVPGRVQRAVHGVDLETDAGPVPVLPGPAGPTRAGLCHTLIKTLKIKKDARTFVPIGSRVM